MKLIDVSTAKHPNMFAIVDDDDYDSLIKRTWRARPRGGKVYVRSSLRLNNKRVSLSMHRVIMGTPSGFVVDHIDGNPLNNQKSNMRNCTVSQNAKNLKKRDSASSKFKGVRRGGINQRWSATIYCNYKCIHIGSFNTETDAAKAYNEAAIKYHGEFAQLNTTPKEKNNGN